MCTLRQNGLRGPHLPQTLAWQMRRRAGHMVGHALERLQPAEGGIVFIENVGNLVCPASFDLGHHLNITLLSTTEGEDKPSKYPVMFRAADLLLITKADLLPVLDDFNVDKATENFRKLSKQEPVITVSSKKTDGFEQWLDWLEQQLQAHRSRLREGKSTHPNLQKDGIEMHQHHEQPHGHHHHHAD